MSTSSTSEYSHARDQGDSGTQRAGRRRRGGTVLLAGTAVLALGGALLVSEPAPGEPSAPAYGAAAMSAHLPYVVSDGASPDRRVDDAASRDMRRIPARPGPATSAPAAAPVVGVTAADPAEQARKRAAERKAQRKAERKAQRKAQRKAERKAQRKAQRKAERKAQRKAARKAQKRQRKAASRSRGVADVTLTPAARSHRSARERVSLRAWRNSPHARMIVWRESNGRCDVVSSNGLWRGCWQMTMTLWRGYGGRAYAPSPERASCPEQDRVAYKVWLANGWKPWGG